MNVKRPIDADSFPQGVEPKNGERMDERFSSFPESNPFSTRFTAPGKTPFFFERSFLRRMKAAHPAKFEEFFVRALGSGEDIRGSVCIQFLIDRFEANSRRGQLVGPHGSGKSTLLFSLKEALAKRGYEIFSWALRDQRSFLPDVFWLELQRFLQSAPAFLPVKCLLPPPVVSREEYWAQRRKATGESDVEPFETNATAQDAAPIAQFCVDSPTDAEPEIVETPRETSAAQDRDSDADGASRSSKPEGFFGFNAAGNFGFNKRAAAPQNVRTETTTDAAANDVSGDAVSPPFAPFPGVAPPNEVAETRLEPAAPEPRADLKPVDSTPESAVELFEQKKLEIPLPLGFDLEKSRSFFEKKVVLFDGFEQLSYVNRIILRTFCRMNRLGLLLTTHSPAIGIPVLFRTSPSVETLRQVLNFLLDDLDMTPDDADLAALLKNFNCDIREILFSLYDAFENYRWAPREFRQKLARRYPR